MNHVTVKQYPSIFNDVIGPVMRGPSSSHTAASVRIGRMMRQLISGDVAKFLVQFEPKGSLAATYHTQCADIGLVGGILGMRPQDEELINAIEIAKEKGIEIIFEIVEYEAKHPNTYKMTITDVDGHSVEATALSVGGGMIEMIEIEHIPVFLTGGFFETLLFLEEGSEVEQIVKGVIPEHIAMDMFTHEGKQLIEIKTKSRISKEQENELSKLAGIGRVCCLDCVLPIQSQVNPTVPFTNGESMLAYGNGKLQMWELAAKYESVRGDITEEQVLAKMLELVQIMKSAVKQGLEGTEYEDRILGFQSNKITNQAWGGDMTKKIIAYISAIMEVKSAMGTVVAAPTAGSCGGLPGTVIAIADEMHLDDEKVAKAMLSAGIVGVFIASGSTFAAEVAGCQAECGAGSGMTAAAIVELMEGNALEASDAASMALQNILGMVCDPVAGRVEVPCLGKNIMCGMNALTSANMAVAGFDVVIPLDQTIIAMDEVGRAIPSEFRCTGNGGLSVVDAARAVEKRLGQ